MMTPTENYKINANIAISLIIQFSLMFAGSYMVEFETRTKYEPYFQKNEFRFPESHSRIKITDYIFETFLWKVAAQSDDDIQVKILNIQWSEFVQSKIPAVELPESNIKMSHGYELGCPIKSVTFFPWRFNNGKLEFAKSFQLSILYPDEKIVQQNIPGEIINPENIVLKATNLTEYLILAPDNFEEAALSLQSLHQHDIEGQFQLQTEIYFISQILDEISSDEDFLTSQDIVNFLDMKIIEFPTLKYLLIFGDETHFPPKYSGSIPSDDLYTWNQNGYPQLATGRIPVSQSFEAVIVAEKIRNYMLSPQPGIWRQKIALIADDHRHPDGGGDSEFSHTINTEGLINVLKNIALVQPYFGSEFESEPNSGWINLPQMTNDLIQQINSGVAMLNYIGHGSPTTLAHEQILNMDRDLSVINPEQGREAIWIVGTCSFGYYDNESSMSEELLKKQSGAIGLITTSRSVGVGVNDQYLDRTFELISQYLNNENDYRLGEIFYHTKSFFQSSNYKVFHLFGDPALILPFPQIDNILELPDSSEFIQMTEHYIPTMLTAGSDPIITITGPEWINEVYSNEFANGVRTITHPGNILYQSLLGELSTILIPLDIPKCDHCLDIKLYAQSNEFTGSFDYSQYGSIIINPDAILDSVGPQISILKDGKFLPNGSVVYQPANIQISFSDESGINLVGGIGHELLVKINENETIDLSQLYYISADGIGMVDFLFPDYLIGSQTILVSAWDNANNNSTLENTFYFSEKEKFQLSHVFPYPNPFKRNVDFTFQLSEQANVKINVYSLAGDEIFTINESSAGPGFVRIPWNAKDNAGRIVPNGVFIYIITAENNSGKVKSAMQKMMKVE